MEMRYIGYHETAAENVESILCGGFVVVHPDDDIAYLGAGIYFWDNNITPAHNWANRKKHHQYVIFKASIGVEERRCLDLVPLERQQELETFARKLAARTGAPHEEASRRLGAVINLYCRFYQGDYDVVRAIYPVNHPINRPDAKPLFVGPSPLVANIIISVRNPTCIIEHDIVFCSLSA